ncbi:MAG: DUF3842 family protein [Clostridia bacterium]|nr:DUF3842 family protein [Clostridia bacterium]
MNITIIDGQGGQLGAQLTKEVLLRFPDINLTVIGTNTIATSAMLKAGAKNAATGENPIVVACRKSDVIIGPVGIVIADSLHGEITEKMAVAVGKSDAVRILIPMNKCDNLIAGITHTNTKKLIDDTIDKLKNILDSNCC